MILRRQAALGYPMFPSHLVIVSSLHGVLSRDSCLQPDTRTFQGTAGHVVEGLLAVSTASCLGNVHAKSFQLHTANVSPNTGGITKNYLKLCNTHSQTCQEVFNLKSSLSYPQNCMVEQPRNQVSEMYFDKFPDPSTFQCPPTSFKTEVCSCSGFPTDAMMWIQEEEMVESVDDLETSQSVFQHCSVKGSGILSKFISET